LTAEFGACGFADGTSSDENIRARHIAAPESVELERSQRDIIRMLRCILYRIGILWPSELEEIFLILTSP